MNADLLAKKRGLRIVETVVPSDGDTVLKEIEVGRTGKQGRAVQCSRGVVRAGWGRGGAGEDQERAVMAAATDAGCSEGNGPGGSHILSMLLPCLFALAPTRPSP